MADVDLLPVCNLQLCDGPNALRMPRRPVLFGSLHGRPQWSRFAVVPGVDASGGVTFGSLNLSIQAEVKVLDDAIAVDTLV